MITNSDKSLIAQLLEVTHEVALEEGLVTQRVLDFYTASIAQAEDYLSTDSSDRTSAVIDKIKEDIERQDDGLNEAEMLALTRLMAVDSVVVNAANNYYQIKSQPTVEDRFKAVIEELLGDGNDITTNAEFLSETIENLLISMVFTMHPVIFHSPEARKGEQALSARLEAMGQLIEDNEGRIPDGFIADFRDKMRKNIDAIARGATVTPFDQITIASETQTEVENIERITFQLPRIIDAWNRAVDLVTGEKRIEAEPLKISDGRAEEIFELRTWGRSADADGRTFATSMALFEGVAMSIGDHRQYEGPKLDLRQNSEMHRDYISILIQLKYQRDKEFREFCHAFIEERNVQSEEGGWISPTHSIFQQLPEADRANLLKQIMQRGFDLTPTRIAEDTLAFNRLFLITYKNFLEQRDYSPDTTFQQMNRDDQNDLCRLLEEKGYSLDYDGLSYGTIGLDDTGVGLLYGRRKLDGEGRITPIPDPQKPGLVDISKRLAIISDSIVKHGPTVADRHQIANFEEPADFYSMLMLMEQHGLVSITDGQVTEVKVGIMPLLETVPDMQRAPEIFRNLLKDDLVRNYYLQRGIGEIMLGFSDGSKSAGNFASQWEIYKTARELEQIFQEAFASEIERGEFKGMRFLQGRGRGMDRGGTLEMGTAIKLLPQGVAKSGVFDVTTQADQPMNMAASPSVAQDTIASMMIGMITARQATIEPIDRNEQERIEAYEKVIDFIAGNAGATFGNLVKDNPEALDFINGVPVNPERTSRSNRRAGTIKGSWDSTRAIAVEYGFNLAKLPAHDVGLKAAIQLFEASGIEVPDKEGNILTGMDALREVYKNHEFFRAMIDVRLVAIEHQYDPVIAREYGKMSGTETFVANATAELDGLHNILRGISRTSSHVGREEERKQTNGVNPLSAIGIVAHAVIKKFGGKRPDKEHHPDQAKIVNNASFCSAMEFGHPEISPELRRNAERIPGRTA